MHLTRQRCKHAWSTPIRDAAHRAARNPTIPAGRASGSDYGTRRKPIHCNSRAFLGHLVIGPTGVFVIDSKRYRGHLHYSAGRLWHGRRALDHTLDTLWWEATQVAETLGFGPDLHVYPVLCVHVARLPWLRELLVDGIPVLAAGTLRPALRVIRQALSPEQVELVAAQVRSGFQPAA